MVLRVSEPTRLGFVGLGSMGRPMALNLAKAGHRVIAWDVSSETRDKLRDELLIAEGLIDIFRSTDAVLLMLPNGEIVRDVLLDEDTLFAASSASFPLLVDMSSSDPIVTKQTGQLLDMHGLSLFDAPVSGGVRRAENSTLAIMLGADDLEGRDRVEKLLTSLGQVTRTGPLGSGHAMKALNNYVSAAGLTAACEAIGAVKAFGLDPEVFLGVLNKSTGRNVATESKIAQHVLNGEFAAGFAMALMAKDLTTAERLSDSVGLDAPGLRQLASRWREASESLPNADHTEIARMSGAVS